MNKIKEDNDGEIAALKVWLDSLSYKQLIDAMSFPFKEDVNGRNYEYELFTEMIKSQSPLPTPVHPRAMGVKLASNGFANDGRNEYQRVLRNRLIKPRLFQFIERPRGDSLGIDNLASLPPEIASMVRKEKKIERRQNAAVNFDVIARNFVAADGQILSLGSTDEMKEADEHLLLGSYIQNGCRLVNGSGREQNSIWCTFKIWDDCRDCRHASILRMIYVVSRGFAFKCSPKHVKGGHFASWFDPTVGWFSLSAYLANRFEVAIWETFRRSNQDSTCMRLSRQTVIAHAFSRLPPKELERCLSSAVVHALKKSLSEAPLQGKTRDCFLFKYASFVSGRHFMRHHAIEDFYLIPLVQLHSPKDKFRLFMVEYCELHISRLAETELIEIASSTNSTENKSKNKKRRKKKKRKKSSQKSKGIHLKPIDEKKGGGDADANITASINNIDKEKDKNTIELTSDGKCLVTNPLHQDQSDDGFLTTNQETEKKKKSPVKKFVLKKAKGAPRTSQRMQAIAKPPPKCNVDLASVYLSTEIANNQLTMKRSNITNSIWNAPPLRYNFPDPNLKSPHDNAKASQPIKLQQVFSPFTLPIHDQNEASPKRNRLFDLSTNVGLPINSDDDFLHGMKPYEGWGFSLYSDFFDNNTGNRNSNFASSTAASIASSVLDNDDNSSLQASSDDDVEGSGHFNTPAIHEKETQLPEKEKIEDKNCDIETVQSSKPRSKNPQNLHSNDTIVQPPESNTSQSLHDSDSEESEETLPDAPATPPAQLSPILLSLADLGELRRRATRKNFSDILEESSAPNELQPPSLASLPVPKRSYSREDLRISTMKDDGDVRKKIPPCSSRTVDFSSLSYRNAALKNARRARSVSSHDFSDKAKYLRPLIKRAPSMKSFTREIKEVIIDGSINLNICAQSESALDDHEDSSHWNVIPKIGFDDNATTTRDGATTISSIPTPHEIDEIVLLREERDSYRDMCLTMAAEISKLKNTLALERINSDYSMPQTETPFGSDYMSPFYHRGKQGGARRYAAMSDAGLNDIPLSEDGTDAVQSSVAVADIGKRRISRNNSISNNRIQATSVSRAGGSDIASLDHDNTTYSAAPTTIPCYKYSGPNHLHGLQSRLSRDIDHFITAITTKLKRQESRRSVAIKRLTALVNAIWPRAQVKMYGSHETNLRLPSSDLDFVICLPNVHKKAPADAPGALEGRNAINESNQKLLARKLKSESWIEPRSIKIIERTVIPVIKVSTKDARSRSLHLDISFDSQGHHGLESVEMVTKTLENFPMVRPIVLVLKQFLMDKGLLTAYTGGLSSHSLFLMVTRYIQEQNLAWVDAGSLLMGFLDFYGNVFEPRSVGISVSNGGQYFRREHRLPFQRSASKSELSRRHSFQYHDQNTVSKIVPDTARPFTFDPIFVEDPISLGNNVGRNSFRINQVQRAFSDAHRTLVANLEWDMNSSDMHENDGMRYPLLKSLLQNNEAFY